jgi:DNA-binding SARP family transcriptional activator
LVRAAALRLTERWWQVFEDHADLRLGLGADCELVGELRDAAATDPLREGVHARLMRALAQVGRPAEALAAYRTARETFIDTLGIEPSEGLRRLESAILRGHVGPEPAGWLLGELADRFSRRSVVRTPVPASTRIAPTARRIPVGSSQPAR